MRIVAFGLVLSFLYASLFAQRASAQPMQVFSSGKKTAVAKLICVPDIYNSAQSFASIGRTLSERGIDVYSMDLRGFGTFADTPDKNKLDLPSSVNDLIGVIQVAKATDRKVPLFLLGEGLGYAVALQATLRRQDAIEGFVFSNPSIAANKFRSSEKSAKRKLAPAELRAYKQALNLANEHINEISAPKLLVIVKDQSNMTSPPQGLSQVLSDGKEVTQVISPTVLEGDVNPSTVDSIGNWISAHAK